MFGIKGIEAVQFGSGVMGVEAPVDGGLGDVALRNQGLDLPPESFLVGECSSCPGRPGPPRPPDRPRPPANASDGQSPPSCAVGSPPRAATRPAARRPRTGSVCPRADTRSSAAAEFRAGAAEMAGSQPTTGWRSRQSRPPAFAGHRVPRIGPAGPPCAPRSRRSPWGCTTPSSAKA